MAVQNTGTDIINAVGNALSYVWGQCTRWVSENLSWIPAGLGNAGDWLANAQKKGLPTGSTPEVGSVAVWGAGTISALGHVAIVKSIDTQAQTITVSEENYLGQGITDLRTVSLNNTGGIIGYIYPPGGSSSSSSSSSTDLANINFPGGSIQIPNPLQAIASMFQLPDVSTLFWRAGLIIVGIFLFVKGLENSGLPGTEEIKLQLPQNGGFARGQHSDDESSSSEEAGGEEAAASGGEAADAAAVAA